MHIRNRRGATVAGTLVLAAVAACLTWAFWPTRVRSGSALAESGPPSMGTIGATKERIGAQLAFTLPFFDNRSDEQLTIKSVRLLKVPSGWKILGYRSLEVSDLGGVGLSWTGTYSPARDDPRPHFRPVEGIKVPPRTLATRYAMAWVRIDGCPTGNLEGVEVTYEADGITYRQTMHAEYSVSLAADE